MRNKQLAIFRGGIEYGKEYKNSGKPGQFGRNPGPKDERTNVSVRKLAARSQKKKKSDRNEPSGPDSVQVLQGRSKLHRLQGRGYVEQAADESRQDFFA